MQKIELFPYQRIRNEGQKNHSSKETKKNRNPFVPKDIVVNLIALLLGRVIILSSLAPFGLAFYAASFMGEAKSMMIGISIMVGLISSGIGIVSVKYMAAMIIFTGFYLFSKNELFKKKFFVALTAGAGLFSAGIIPVMTQGFLLYDILVLLFEAFITFVMVFIFHTGIPFLKQRVNRKMLSNEELISLSILMGLVIVGLVDIHFPGGISLRNTLCILIILMFGLKKGVAVAASTGVTIGLINSITSPRMPLLIGCYAFCGLVSGVFKPFGKVGVSLAFILANAIFTIYVNGSTEVLINIYDIFAAVAIFSLMPAKTLEYIGNFLNKNPEVLTNRKASGRKLKEILVGRLHSISTAFEQLAHTFTSISQKQIAPNTSDVTVLFDQVAERVCKDCGLCLCCWEREFHNTYQIMFKILEKLEDKGRVDERDVPENFRNRCMRIDYFIEVMNSMFEIYQLNLLWRNKVGESRGLISQQLQGVSKIIANLAKEITTDLQFDADMEKELMLELDKTGIIARDVTVLQNTQGKYEIEIAFKSCGGIRKCVNVAAPVVCKIAGRKMVKENTVCSASKRNTRCTVKYIEEEVYQISTGIAQFKKEGQVKCGDHYSFMQLKDGKYVLALSDGMGSGDRASKESSATIALLEQFLDSGFDKDTAVKLINSVLVLKSPEESFATIDLSAIDLHSGNVEFAKIGSVSTFIKKGTEVEVIKSTSLPVGILDNIDMEISSKTVSDGNYIVMMTDGVLDSNRKIVRKEVWVRKVLEEIETTNPQEIADRLLKKALENYGHTVKDDMTILVAKVWKKVS